MRLIRIPSYGSRIEQIATIGDWLIVREYGRVFASDAKSIKWRPMSGFHDVASEPDGDRVFVLLDSLRPALLNPDLHFDWTSDRVLPVAAGSDIEQPIFRYGVGYVPEGFGSIHEIKNKTLRVVRPADTQEALKASVTTISPR